MRHVLINSFPFFAIKCIPVFYSGRKHDAGAQRQFAKGKAGIGVVMSGVKNRFKYARTAITKCYNRDQYPGRLPY